MGRVKTQKAKKPKKIATPTSQFNDAIEKLIRFQKQNAKFREELAALSARVMPEIEDAELDKLEAVRLFVLKLITFFSKKTLPEYLREELYELIMEKMDLLENNPFSHKIDFSDVEQSLNSAIVTHMGNLTKKDIKKLEKQGISEEEIKNMNDMVDKLVDNVDSPDALDDFAKELEGLLGENRDTRADENRAEADEYFTDDLFGEDDSLFEDDDPFEDFFSTHENAENIQEIELSTLFKSTSVNKLFRRIAKQIHPDLVQDQQDKQERHEKMSRLIEAREQKDVATILHMYKEIFGDLPEDFPQSDLPKMTKIIHLQIEKLKQEKHNILHEKPFQATFYQLFDAKTIQQQDLKIKSHIADLKSLRQSYLQLSSSLTSIAKLKELLAERSMAMYY